MISKLQYFVIARQVKCNHGSLRLIVATLWVHKIGTAYFLPAFYADLSPKLPRYWYVRGMGNRSCLPDQNGSSCIRGSAPRPSELRAVLGVAFRASFSTYKRQALMPYWNNDSNWILPWWAHRSDEPRSHVHALSVRARNASSAILIFVTVNI